MFGEDEDENEEANKNQDWKDKFKNRASTIVGSVSQKTNQVVEKTT